MKKSSLYYLLPLIILGLPHTGCESYCTHVGCNDGFSITISDERPDSLSINIYLNDNTDAFVTRLCTHQDNPCIIGINEQTPGVVSVEIDWKNGEFNEIFNPEYEDIQPNGPSCPPTCAIAKIEIDLSGD